MWRLLSQTDRFLSPLILLLLSLTVSWHSGLSSARRGSARGNRLPSNSAPPRSWLATRTIADADDTTFVPIRPTVLFLRLFRAIYAMRRLTLHLWRELPITHRRDDRRYHSPKFTGTESRNGSADDARTSHLDITETRWTIRNGLLRRSTIPLRAFVRGSERANGRMDEGAEKSYLTIHLRGGFEEWKFHPAVFARNIYTVI